MLYTTTDLLEDAVRRVVLEGKHYIDGAFAKWTASSLLTLFHTHEAVEVHRMEARLKYHIVSWSLHELVKQTGEAHLTHITNLIHVFVLTANQAHFLCCFLLLLFLGIQEFLLVLFDLFCF